MPSRFPEARVWDHNGTLGTSPRTKRECQRRGTQLRNSGLTDLLARRVSNPKMIILKKQSVTPQIRHAKPIIGVSLRMVGWRHRIFCAVMTYVLQIILSDCTLPGEIFLVPKNPNLAPQTAGWRTADFYRCWYWIGKIVCIAQCTWLFFLYISSRFARELFRGFPLWRKTLITVIWL